MGTKNSTRSTSQRIYQNLEIFLPSFFASSASIQASWLGRHVTWIFEEKAYKILSNLNLASSKNAQRFLGSNVQNSRLEACSFFQYNKICWFLSLARSRIVQARSCLKARYVIRMRILSMAAKVLDKKGRAQVKKSILISILPGIFFMALYALLCAKSIFFITFAAVCTICKEVFQSLYPRTFSWKTSFFAKY